MCIATWIWQTHPHYPLILLFNRDELHNRPTKPVGWWGEDNRKILGGRDIVGGGTWLGCSRDGKVAFLTNVLEPDLNPTAKTRGDLPLRFLESKKSPMEIGKEIAKEAHGYNGFNLILADICNQSLIYLSNRPKEEPVDVHVVSQGLHVLANASLDTPWPKARRLANNFGKVLRQLGEEEFPAHEMVAELMGDTNRADKNELPKTGCHCEWEFKTSSIFIDAETNQGRFGTRSTSAVSITTDGMVNFYEKYLENGDWKDHTLQYHIEKQN